MGCLCIEKYLPRWDLTHVLDTAGAYIPGHGTPTVILFGKNQPPVSATIRTVLGIRGEPSTPHDPAFGLVWQAIVQQVDKPDSVSEWMSAADSPREKFHHHPWSIGGGGAAELKDHIQDQCADSLGDWATELGITSVTGEDDLFVFPQRIDLIRLRVERTRPLVTGDLVREWQVADLPEAVWLYDDAFQLLALRSLPKTAQLFWSCRTSISRRRRFGTPMVERGLTWYEWQELYPAKLRTLLSITFAFVATHNHFVIDYGAKVFKQSAPVIKLKPDATLDQHVKFVGILNSSAACFWMKQVAHNKGSTVDEHGARQRTAPFEDFYEFTATQLESFPIPARQPNQLPTALVNASTTQQGRAPAATLASWGSPESGDLRVWLARARDEWHRLHRQMIAWQEELDWQIYESFGLVEAGDQVGLPDSALEIPPVGIELGQRAFEIVLARRMAAGEAHSTWFERHSSTPFTEVPRHWPAPYRDLVERRIQRIADDSNIRLIEQPEYKRRWNTEPWDEQLEKALEKWLLDRIERVIGRDLNAPEGSEASKAFQPKIELLTTQEISDLVLQPDFREAAEIYRGRADFDPHKLVAELIQSAAVPFLPGQRYKETGLRKRVVWEETWDKQRAEDAIDDELGLNAPNLSEADRKRLEADAKVRKAQRIGDIPVPPKYASADFRSSTYWSLRGKLDVPKERFISYPGCSRDGDPCLTVAWAGLDHLQQAQALAAHYGNLQATGAGQPKLLLVLAGLNELLPWLKQWHNQLDPEFGLKMGDYFKGYLREEAKRFGKSLTDLKQLAMTH